MRGHEPPREKGLHAPPRNFDEVDTAPWGAAKAIEATALFDFHAALRALSGNIGRCSRCARRGPGLEVATADGPPICGACSTHSRFTGVNNLSLWPSDMAEPIRQSIIDAFDDLTVAEAALLRPLIPCVSIHRLQGGQFGYSGHSISLMSEAIREVTLKLPRSPSDCGIRVVERQGKASTNPEFVVRRSKVDRCLRMLLEHNPYFKTYGIELDEEALADLPEGHVPDGLVVFLEDKGAPGVVGELQITDKILAHWLNQGAESGLVWAEAARASWGQDYDLQLDIIALGRDIRGCDDSSSINEQFPLRHLALFCLRTGVVQATDVAKEVGDSMALSANIV